MATVIINKMTSMLVETSELSEYRKCVEFLIEIRNLSDKKPIFMKREPSWRSRKYFRWFDPVTYKLEASGEYEIKMVIPKQLEVSYLYFDKHYYVFESQERGDYKFISFEWKPQTLHATPNKKRLYLPIKMDFTDGTYVEFALQCKVYSLEDPAETKDAVRMKFLRIDVAQEVKQKIKMSANIMVPKRLA